MGHNIKILKNWPQKCITNLEKNSYWIWSFYDRWNITVIVLVQFWLYVVTRTENDGRSNFSSQKIYMVQRLELSIVVWSHNMLLWRIWESDVKKGHTPLHTFLQIFYKNFKILVLSYNLSHFVPIFRKTEKKRR